MSERERLVQELEASRDALVAAIDGLSEAQWRFRPADGGWTVEENVEHLVVSARSIGALVMRRLRAGPDAADLVATPLAVRIRARMADRSVRAEVPEMVRPTGHPVDRAAATAEFVALREVLLAFVREPAHGLRAGTAPHPRLGELDAAEWLAFVAAHELRHVAQLMEVRRAVGFPEG